jgi:hypothetical protein
METITANPVETIIALVLIGVILAVGFRHRSKKSGTGGSTPPKTPEKKINR